MGELSVAAPNNNNNCPTVHSGRWNPTPLRSANNGDMNSSIGGGKARKRDFRFQIIQVRQGPKWFIWPSQNGNNASTPDANENVVCSGPAAGQQQNCSDQENHLVSSNDSGNFSSSGNGPSMRRSSRFMTSRRKISVNQNSDASAPLAVEGDMVRVTATNHGPSAAPMSEPTTRRLTCRMSKPAPTTPGSSGFSSPASSSSAMSTDSSPSGFQILSVSRKCESDDESEDFLECSCRAMSLSMDDEAINALASTSNNDGQLQHPSGIRSTPSITITEPPPSPIVKNACST
ncbi:Protein T19H5.4 b [Aphelenchoides avenae]|nr:Protein T19H5.4 b [Aphelenchus avenae]